MYICMYMYISLYPIKLEANFNSMDTRYRNYFNKNVGVGGSFDRETAVILEAELKKRKELFSRFDFTVENVPIARFPAPLSKKYGS